LGISPTDTGGPDRTTEIITGRGGEIYEYGFGLLAVMFLPRRSSRMAANRPLQ
jgi:hypothetical protein